jgi:hypothetical protein
VRRTRMDTPPRDKKANVVNPRQLHARLKTQMDNDMEMDVEASHPSADRLDEALVHTNAIKPLADDFDDGDLD